MTTEKPTVAKLRAPDLIERLRKHYIRTLDRTVGLIATAQHGSEQASP
jgi:hypothetical protein